MKMFNIIKEAVAGFLEVSSQDWWIEVTTKEPCCTYYFGPFEKSSEAKDAHSGYIEDLQREGAQGIEVDIKRCQPEALTVCNES